MSVVPRPRPAARGTARRRHRCQRRLDAYFRDVVSYELAAKYPADPILYDRDPSGGQFAPWHKLEGWSYASDAADIEATLAAVRTADAALV